MVTGKYHLTSSMMIRAGHSRAEPAPVQMGAGIQIIQCLIDSRLRGCDVLGSLFSHRIQILLS